MKTKEKDKLYCNVNAEKISKAQPKLDEHYFKVFTGYINERYMIHLKKDVRKSPKPWTEDEILQNYRFTNVRREHDRETLWLIDNIVKSDKITYEDKLVNIILFRLFNKHETAELLEMPIAFSKYTEDDWSPELYRSRIEEYKQKYPNKALFTGAFNTGGMKRALKWYLINYKSGAKCDSMEMRVLSFIKYLVYKEKIKKKIKSQKTQKDVFDLLRSYLGIGDFLAYQMFVDFTYILKFPFSENEFVVAGPGCISGMNYVFKDFDGLNNEEALFWLRDNWDELIDNYTTNYRRGTMFSDLPEYDRKMNVMCLENCFCEISKYIRVLEGTGRPKNTYNGKR